MRSVIVLGCRAAGTSMVARLLAPAGYRVDDGGTPPSLDAPFGRFELVEMRRLEDALLNPRIEAGSTCRAPGIPRFARDGRERKPWRFAPHLREHARRFLEAGPVVLRDERLAFTLDAWRGLAPEARIVCIFRSPERVARSLARKLGLSIDSALSEWTATYRAVLELANRGCEILFLEADQLFEPETRARLASVLETTLDANALDPALRPEGGVGIDVEVPEETSEIHRMLLDRADFVPRERGPNAPRDVAALIPIVDRDLAACGPAGIGELLLDLRRDLALSRGARVRPVWIDATSEGLDRFPPRGSGHGLPDPLLPDLVLRAASPTRVGAWRAAADAVEERILVLTPPHTRTLPTRIAHALDALDQGAACVTCDAYLADSRGMFVDRASPAAMGATPGPLFEGGMVLTRDAFARMVSGPEGPSDLAAVELELWRALRTEGAVAHVERPGICIAAERYRSRFVESRMDAVALTAKQKESANPPAITVIVRSQGGAASKRRLLRTLEALGRQSTGPRAFEVLVVDTAGDAAALTRTLDPAFPLRTLDRSRAGQRTRGADANAALSIARGGLVLFLETRTVPAPDLLEVHLAAHALGSGPSAPRVGIELGPDRANAALEHWLTSEGAGERAPLVEPHRLRPSNLSLPLEVLVEHGGFDAALDEAAAGDLLLRLEASGLRAAGLPGARTFRQEPCALVDLETACVGDGRALAELEARHGRSVLARAPRWVSQPLEVLAEEAAVSADADRRCREALDEFTRLDLSTLESLGSPYSTLVAEIRGELVSRVPGLLDAWLRAGYVEARLAREERDPGAPRVDLERDDDAAVPQLARRPATPELTLIVPTHDRPRELKRLIESLAAQDLDPRRFEVLVVDDASTPPARETLAGVRAPFALSVLRQNGLGPGPARNLAIREARGELVLFLNDDAVPDARLLSGHLLRHRMSDEPTAVLGTFTLLPEHRRHSVGEYVERTTCLFAQPAMKPGVRYHGRSFCTGNVSIPRRFLEAVGGFDPALPYAGGEDSELGFRLEARFGLRVVFDPDLGCGHDHAIDARSILRRKRVLGWTLARIQDRHGDLGLLPLGEGAPWPLPQALVGRLESDLAGRAREIDQLVREIDALTAREIETGCGPRNVAALSTPFGEAQRLEMLRGVVDACRGRLPVDAPVEPRAALPGPRTEERIPGRA